MREDTVCRTEREMGEREREVHETGEREGGMKNGAREWWGL